MKKEDIVINGKIVFTNDHFTIIAGPCAVEDEGSLVQTAALLQKYDLKILRGGTNKLRTSPYSFQGLGENGVLLLSLVAKDHGLFSTTEITQISEIDFLYKHIDIFLVGTRNMYNYQLLKELSKQDKPVILKRGMCATIKEWILAAEYLIENGKKNIILCERGIRTFDDTLRNTFDLAAAVYTNMNTAYHVITDPSHATGNRELIEPLVRASKAAGISGVMLEIHPDPEKALSDGKQMINFQQFEKIMKI